MRAPNSVLNPTVEPHLVDGDRVADALDSMLCAREATGAREALILEGLISLIVCDVVAYAEDTPEGVSRASFRVRHPHGWSTVAVANGIEEAFQLMAHRIEVHLGTFDGTEVTYGCARAWRPFDDLEQHLLTLVRSCVAHVAAERTSAAEDTLDLTEREMDVLLRVARGLTNAEVAAQLFVAPGTVKKHLDHIYRKLGVNGRTEAAARVIRSGMHLQA